MAGRSTYCEDIAADICERIADGESLRSICRDSKMPTKSTVFKWLVENEAFSDQYARARECQADSFVDDITDIADTEDDSTRARVRIDARKWASSKLAPKKYGDKLDMNLGGQDGNPVQHQVIERRIVDSRKG